MTGAVRGGKEDRRVRGERGDGAEKALDERGVLIVVFPLPRAKYTVYSLFVHVHLFYPPVSCYTNVHSPTANKPRMCSLYRVPSIGEDAKPWTAQRGDICKGYPAAQRL